MWDLVEKSKRAVCGVWSSRAKVSQLWETETKNSGCIHTLNGRNSKKEKSIYLLG